jgi:hypothetical protein
VPPGRDEALSAVRRTTGELADVAEKTADEAERLLADAQQHVMAPVIVAQRFRKGACNSSHDEKSP